MSYVSSLRLVWFHACFGLLGKVIWLIQLLRETALLLKRQSFYFSTLQYRYSYADLSLSLHLNRFSNVNYKKEGRIKIMSFCQESPTIFERP